MNLPVWHDEEGATAVEYAMMVAGIAAAVILIVFLVGTNTFGLFDCTRVSIETETSSC